MQCVGRRFYHPARMALVAVGDFDARFVEMRIKDRRMERLQPVVMC